MKSLKKKKIIRVNGFLMLLYKNRIVVTGGTGRFGCELKKIKNKYKLFFPKKDELNILKISSIEKYLRVKKPKYLIHLAGLSRPMEMHEQFLKKSIDLNIIGTANITKICSNLNIKLIKWLSSKIGIKTKFISSSELDVSGSKTELLINICKKINANYYSNNTNKVLELISLSLE